MSNSQLSNRQINNNNNDFDYNSDKMPQIQSDVSFIKKRKRKHLDRSLKNRQVEREDDDTRPDRIDKAYFQSSINEIIVAGDGAADQENGGNQADEDYDDKRSGNGQLLDANEHWHNEKTKIVNKYELDWYFLDKKGHMNIIR
jgi:hypothetical protein